MTTDKSPPSTGQPPSTIAGYGLAISRALEYRGIDPGRVFRAADVPLPQDNDPLRRLPLDAVTRLYRACVDVTHDPYFGLTVAKFVHTSNLHALGHALLASSTLLDFCQRLERYFRLVSQVATVELVEVPDGLALRTHSFFEPCAETEDAWLAIVLRFMREIHRRSFKPMRVEFHHTCPDAGPGPYAAYFGAPVSFEHLDSAIVFAKDDLVRRLQGACPEVAQANDQLAASYLLKIERSDIVALVRATIVNELPSGNCSRGGIAETLHLSEATLQSRLSHRGTSFQELLDDTRCELACGYVQRSGMSVTEMAYLLGFSDVSNFTRAFKRWTGKSPSSFRAPRVESDTDL